MFDKANDKAREVWCTKNQIQIGTALLQYSQDYDGKLPDAAHWADDIAPYTKSELLLKCPSDKRSSYGYAFNSVESHKNVSKMTNPEATILLYDSTAGTKNATDAVTSLPSPGRHRGDNVFTFADGHVRSKTTSTSTGRDAND